MQAWIGFPFRTVIAMTLLSQRMGPQNKTVLEGMKVRSPGRVISYLIPDYPNISEKVLANGAGLSQ